MTIIVIYYGSEIFHVVVDSVYKHVGIDRSSRAAFRTANGSLHQHGSPEQSAAGEPG